jgi:hypothetical protein
MFKHVFRRLCFVFLTLFHRVGRSIDKGKGKVFLHDSRFSAKKEPAIHRFLFLFE